MEQQKPSLVRRVSIVLVVLAVLCVIALALTNHPVVAAKFFAALLICMGIFRIYFRKEHVWFGARSWWADALVLIAMGVLAAYLSPYAGVIMPTPASL